MMPARSKEEMSINRLDIVCVFQSQEKKAFFSEEKKQKTFVCYAPAARETPSAKLQKFFASFFQKRRPSFP
jgi:hypothetical protein